MTEPVNMFTPENSPGVMHWLRALQAVEREEVIARGRHRARALYRVYGGTGGVKLGQDLILEEAERIRDDFNRRMAKSGYIFQPARVDRQVDDG